MKSLVIASGGLDSLTLAYMAKAEGHLGMIVSFDYGQRHKKELEFAALAAEKLGVPHRIVDLTNITQHLKGSSLTDKVDVPDGHYTELNMRKTVVPNRNAIMLAIAYGIAAGEGCSHVGTAVHSGDHFIYPDCRPEFVNQFNDMERAALGELWDVSLWTPFVHKTKADIAAKADELGMPIDATWSCYKGGEVHCGRCGTCVERQEAMALAGVKDPTVYEDSTFWIGECLKQGSVTVETLNRLGVKVPQEVLAELGLENATPVGASSQDA